MLTLLIDQVIHSQRNQAMKSLSVISLFLFTCTQSLASERVLYEDIAHNKPEVGLESEVYLGDRMLVQARGEWRECITPKMTYKKKSVGYTAEYRANEPICKIRFGIGSVSPALPFPTKRTCYNSSAY